MIELNPLNVIDARKLDFLPIHFSKIKISDLDIYHMHIDAIENWINSRLRGRYCILTIPSIINDRVENAKIIGFEESKELTYFLLSCPYIRRNK
jgi:hypothetical protein